MIQKSKDWVINVKNKGCQWIKEADKSQNEPVFICSACHNKIPQKEIYFLTFLEVKVRDQVHHGWFLVRRLFLPCRGPPSHCVLTWPFLCLSVERAPQCLILSLQGHNCSLIKVSFMMSLNLHTSSEALSPNTVALGGWSFNIQIWQRAQFHL